MPPTESIVEDLGYLPNGYFWERVARWLMEQQAIPEIKMDPEAGLFAAYGDKEEVEKFAQQFMVYLTNPASLRELVAQAEAADFDLND